MVAVWLCAILIGLVCGLRALTGPAVVCWGAHFGWLSLAGSPLGFLANPIALVVFTVLALAELVSDKLAKTPARTMLVPFLARIILGCLSGAALAVAGDVSLGVGVVLGVVGAILGTFAGYAYRHATSGSGKVPDLPVALLEDFIAIGGGLFLVSRF
jgi:uncharacterized membrane protein